MNAARLSVASNTILMLGKLAAGFFMGSVSVISDGVHSGIDLLAALIALTAVRQSAKPADERHRFGHGKFENLASIAEAGLIALAAGAIIFNAVPRLFSPTPVGALGLGAGVVLTAIVVNSILSQYLFQVARETDSPALEADAWHLRSDVYTSVAVLVGLGLIHLTGQLIIDPLVGILVSLVILRAAYRLIRDALKNVLDVRLPEEDEAAILAVLEKHRAGYVEFHQLRTRKAGPERHIDLHLVTPAHGSVAEAHALCDRIEKEIEALFPNRVHVLIHIEPCDDRCAGCPKPVKSDCPNEHPG
ncbi:cation diffusion facilitator family transporter [Candidatus Desulforudis audaxviator]|uniref:cation diffusion facilitator family transporter n=1 Tax=Candidatus Desulforudis audaxviator TaxID=471827 RepID=UPI0024337587|nr:cation diffusion facilitator family transporter [Candidatus Desulforudis audaxviator]